MPRISRFTKSCFRPSQHAGQDKRQNRDFHPRPEVLQRYLLLTGGPPPPTVYQANDSNYSPDTAQVLPLPPAFQISPSLATQDVQVEGGHTYLEFNSSTDETHTGYYTFPVTAGETVAVNFQADDPMANVVGWQIGTYWGMAGTLQQGAYGQVVNGKLISLLALPQTGSGLYTSDNTFTVPSDGNVVIFTNQFYYQETDQGVVRDFGFAYDYTYSYAIVVGSTPSQTPPAPASVSLTHLDWNTDQNGTLANAGHRGLDFSYNVSGTIPANLTIPIGFYWATGTDPQDIISPAYSTGQSVPDTIDINTAPGSHGHGMDEAFEDGNDPARWGTPPPNAKFVMAIIDPVNKLGEVDYSNRVLTQALPASPADVLVNSVIAAVDEVTAITATFTPGLGSGEPIPVSEAEVYLGVDHFNWLQTITQTPSTWRNVVMLNLNENAAQPSMEFKDNNIIYLLPYTSLGTVDYFALSGEFLDPVVQLVGGVKFTYGTIFTNNNLVSPLIADTDQYSYYYDEASALTDPASGLNIANKTFYNELDYLDDPTVPAAYSPYPTGSYLYLSTSLVGVKYDISGYVNYAAFFEGTAFNWMSNVETIGQYVSSGGISTYRNDNILNSSDYYSGGITGITYSTPATFALANGLSLQVRRRPDYQSRRFSKYQRSTKRFNPRNSCRLSAFA